MLFIVKLMFDKKKKIISIKCFKLYYSLLGGKRVKWSIMFFLCVKYHGLIFSCWGWGIFFSTFVSYVNNVRTCIASCPKALGIHHSNIQCVGFGHCLLTELDRVSTTYNCFWDEKPYGISICACKNSKTRIALIHVIVYIILVWPMTLV